MKSVTEKQLIGQIKGLKEIKPRGEWVSLIKSQILTEERVVVSQPVKTLGIAEVLQSLLFSRKMAYAFAALLFVIVGLVGFEMIPGKAPNQPATVGQTQLKRNVVALNTKVNNYKQAAKSKKATDIISAKNQISLNAKSLIQDLKDNPVQDPTTIKDLASTLKTLADVQGNDMTANPEMQDLYQVVVENQITDLQKATLTDAQKKTLTEVQDLYSQGKFADALEKILLISK